MEFIALYSDELDMNEVSNCLENVGRLDIAMNEDELLEKVKNSINNVDFYKALFIYPSKNSKIAFDTIKKIRALESEIEHNMRAIIFTDNELGMHLLNKISMKAETYISSKIVKRKILEAIG